MECLTRIQHLKMERERLKRSYRRNCQEINAHIHNCEDSLIGYSRQWAKLKEREINDVQRDNGIYPIDIPVRIGTFDQERTP